MVLHSQVDDVLFGFGVSCQLLECLLQYFYVFVIAGDHPSVNYVCGVVLVVDLEQIHALAHGQVPKDHDVEASENSIPSDDPGEEHFYSWEEEGPYEDEAEGDEVDSGENPLSSVVDVGCLDNLHQIILNDSPEGHISI